MCVPSASSGASSSTAGAAAPEPLGLPPAQLDLVMGQFVQLQRVILEGAADAKRRRKKPSVSSPEVVPGAAPALSPADALVTAAVDAPVDPNAMEESLPITAMLAGLQSALAPVAPADMLPQGSSSSGSSGAGPSALACIPPMSYSGSALLPRAPTSESGMTSGSAPTEQFLEWLALAPPAWVNFANGLSGYYDGMDLTAVSPAPLLVPAAVTMMTAPVMDADRLALPVAVVPALPTYAALVPVIPAPGDPSPPLPDPEPAEDNARN